jgi:hypothetical protein
MKRPVFLQAKSGYLSFLYIGSTIPFRSYANYYNVDEHKMDLARVIVLWRSLNATGAGNAAEALVIS